MQNKVLIHSLMIDCEWDVVQTNASSNHKLFLVIFLIMQTSIVEINL